MVTNCDDDWFITSGNRKIHLTQPDPDVIDINDIAQSLSKICRFGGHCDRFYSVAQHSVWVSTIVPKEYEFIALMHDATEAYLGDIIRPLKQRLPGYKELEDAWWLAIRYRFGIDKLPDKIPDLVKRFDRVALMVERKYLMPGAQRHWIEDELLNGEDRAIIREAGRIVPHTPSDAYDEFMAWYDDLNGRG